MAAGKRTPTQSASSHIRWRRWTKIQPTSDGPLVSNQETKKRALIDRDFLSLLLGSSAFDSRPSIGRLKDLGFVEESQRHSEQVGLDCLWHARDWTLALPYFLSSRVEYFVDDADGEARELAQRKTLERYLEDGPPPRASTPSHPVQHLPQPRSLSSIASGTILRRRVAAQRLPRRALPLDKLSAVLWYGLEEVRFCRTHARELPPGSPLSFLLNFGVAFDVGILSFRTAGLGKGFYLYEPETHGLIHSARSMTPQDLLRATAGQTAVLDAAVAIMLIVDFRRQQWLYRHERALRNLYVDAGRLAQKIILSATAGCLAVHMTPALCDTEISVKLGLEEFDQQVLYCLSIA